MMRSITSIDTPDQEAKADVGKPKLSLVPTQVIKDIAEVREYGNRKYGDPNNWRQVSMDRKQRVHRGICESLNALLDRSYWRRPWQSGASDIARLLSAPR